MGYLSQKKKQANIKELLNISLIILCGCSLITLFGRHTLLAQQINHWLFQIYLYAIGISIYALFNKFYWQTVVMLINVFILFLNIGMGSNLFFNTETEGVQTLKILYQTKAGEKENSLSQIIDNKVDIACILNKQVKDIKTGNLDMLKTAKNADNSMIVTEYKFFRSGEILLSKNSRAGFADIRIDKNHLIFLIVDFQKVQSAERRAALKNLAEFINMQDVPIVVVGNFGVEAWAEEFLDFLEKTKLEVKNRILLSDGQYRFNPFQIPSLNILAYKDFGIKKIEILPAQKNSHHPLLFELNY